MGSEQKENVVGGGGGGGGGWKAEVDTTAPFESVMEAVTRFGGIGYWKPHTRDPSQTTSQADNEKAPDSAKVEDEATHLQNNQVAEERETHEILKEIEATKTRFEELKVKLQKEEAKVDTHPSDSQSDDSDTAANVQGSEVELSKTEILKRVEEATEEAKHCTKVIEEALSRQKSSEFKNLGPPLSIGQILSRKLVLAEENSAKSCIRWKVSLSQVLRKTSNGEKRGGHGGGDKRVPAKRMKFGFCV